MTYHAGMVRFLIRTAIFLGSAAIAWSTAPALLGGVGLLSTFVALAITTAVASGMSITGLDTWVFATLIVWITTMLATLLLPLLVGKRVVDRRRDAG